ncbi:MAG: hypothetical protein J0I69_00665 [Altererythrobacter sp.]|nr:hypothetical protein [Altererythrobacter sp.]OJU59259.1 MAG: hypothetical protein BGO08_06415 [Altererythrobacter sp. 66-12]
MKTLTKALVGTVAAGAMAMTSMSASAAPRDGRGDRNGVDVGDVIAGALIIGGIAAVASAASRGNRYNGYDYRYDNRAGNPRTAVEQCVYAAERNAARYSWRGNAKVTDIRNIDRKRDGYTVKGRIAVNTMGREWRRGDSRYGRGWNNDYRGWNDRYAGYDSGKFTCKVRNGRVVDIDYSGIRGL